MPSNAYFNVGRRFSPAVARPFRVATDVAPARSGVYFATGTARLSMLADAYVHVGRGFSPAVYLATGTARLSMPSDAYFNVGRWA